MSRPGTSTTADERARAYYADAHGVDGFIDLTHITVSPDDRYVAFAAMAGADPSALHVLVHDRDTGLVIRPESSDGTSLPAFGVDRRIAWVRFVDGRSDLCIGTISDAAIRADVATRLPEGQIERLQWSPAGDRLLVLLAEPGASLSDAHGSGRVPATEQGESWQPRVVRDDDAAARRSVHIVHALDGSVRKLACEANAWDATWCGDDRILTIESEQADESAWYEAVVARYGIEGGREGLSAPSGQLAVIAADPSGRHWSIIAGAMSDRGIDSGALWVSVNGEPSCQVATGADVTDQAWVDQSRIVFAGLSGLSTVIGEVEVDTGLVSEVWSSSQTIGNLVPKCAPGGRLVAARATAYNRAPRAVVITAGVAHEIWAPTDKGVRRLEAALPRLEEVRWTSVDGTMIEGLLAVPPGPGPFGLVVEVHGGPVYAHRNLWAAGELSPLLVLAGYAVLHPNIRGSIGRGQRFILDGLNDMCGQFDVADLLSGVEHVAADARIDRARVAIAGLSYGGLMAAWVPTVSTVFSAAISQSPVTEWVSQHYTSDIPAFDVLAWQRDDPLSVSSRYRTRSPLVRAAQFHGAMLLSAGEQDHATPPAQAIMFHRALREHGVDSEVVIYPEEGHGVLAHPARVDWGSRVLRFLARHLST